MKPQEDSSNTKDKQNSKYEKYEIEGTPFTIIEEPDARGDAGYWITMGRYRLEQVTTLEVGKKRAKTITWDRLLQVMTIMLKTQQETNFINEIRK